jgi:hypothetical protein
MIAKKTDSPHSGRWLRRNVVTRLGNQEAGRRDKKLRRSNTEHLADD